jgi:hypothetical protein
MLTEAITMLASSPMENNLEMNKKIALAYQKM